MRTLTKTEWKSIKIGKLDNPLSIEEFKGLYGISDEEYYKAERQGSCLNEYGNLEITFNDDEDDILTVEIFREQITHIYTN